MQTKPIVIKLTGKVFEELKLLARYIGDLEKLAKNGKYVVVTGGGGIARKYISMAKELGVKSNYWLDHIGIQASRLNALLLISALYPYAYPKVVETLEEAVNAITNYNLVVMGGLIPGQSTVAVAVEVAEAVGADTLVDIAAIDYVYDKDPKVYRDAQRLYTINASELAMLLEQKKLPGEYALIDTRALELAIRSRIKIYVTYYKVPENLIKALRGENPGTIIYPR
ncbi:MAG: UMP kinase [Thermoprotei archaeon]|nr:MAG: UMP kinase [Thermoprotei archaeon]